jgi:osmotically-inducible protein OsmY
MQNDLRANVATELRWDPRVDNCDVAVAAHEGVVTLRGSVGTLRHVRQAETAARRVSGVTSVRNYLRVRALGEGPGVDAEIRDAVRQALRLNATIPATIDVRVASGVVHLVGTATWQCQREEAELVCAVVTGVRGIVHEVALVPVSARVDIQRSIMSAYRRNASLNRHLLSVDALASGVVILSGAVTSWGEHDDAVATAWSAPGVTNVDDRILLVS